MTRKDYVKISKMSNNISVFFKKKVQDFPAHSLPITVLFLHFFSQYQNLVSVFMMRCIGLVI